MYKLVRGAYKEHYETIGEELYECDAAPTAGEVGLVCLKIENERYYVENSKIEGGSLVQCEPDFFYWEGV